MTAEVVDGVNACTRYPVTAEPPLLTGAVYLTVMEPLPADTNATESGLAGTAAGTSEVPGEAALVPMALVAFTVKLYLVVGERPVNDCERVEAFVMVFTIGVAPPVAVTS
jgi:hypothetical protein